MMKILILSEEQQYPKKVSLFTVFHIIINIYKLQWEEM